MANLPLWQSYPPEHIGIVMQVENDGRMQLRFVVKRDAYSLMTQLRIMQSRLVKQPDTPKLLTGACRNVKWRVDKLSDDSYMLTGWDKKTESCTVEATSQLEQINPNWFEQVSKLSE